MSRLTNYQIAAQIRGMEISLAGAISRGDAGAVRRAQTKIDAYTAELAERQARGADPDAVSIQEDRRI